MKARIGPKNAFKKIGGLFRPVFIFFNLIGGEVFKIV
jgi:hypothetical protein